MRPPPCQRATPGHPTPGHGHRLSKDVPVGPCARKGCERSSAGGQVRGCGECGRPPHTPSRLRGWRSPSIPNQRLPARALPPAEYLHHHRHQHRSRRLALRTKLSLFDSRLVSRCSRAATHTRTLKDVRLQGVCDREVEACGLVASEVGYEDVAGRAAVPGRREGLALRRDRCAARHVL